MKSSSKKNNFFEESQKRLIGSILAYPKNCQNIVSMLGPEDFSDVILGTIFSAIRSIARKDADVDIFNVALELESEGLLEKIGGYSQLEELHSAGFDWVTRLPPMSYASFVKDGSVKNQTCDVLEEAKKTMTYDSGVSGKEGIEILQHDLGEILFTVSDDSTVSRVDEEVDHYLELIQQRRKVYEENKDFHNGLQGIPSSLDSLNKYTTGWLPGQLITVAARTSIGKALWVQTPILTSLGWKTMGDLCVGDQVIGSDGDFVAVSAATDILYNRECFKMFFSNGSTMIADANHLWRTVVDDHLEVVLTTKEIHGSLFNDQDELRHYIRMSRLSDADTVHIVDIKPVPSVPVKCIQVENEDHMFLAGENLIPTHNSVLAVNSAVAASRANKTVMFFSLEMSSEEIHDRIYSSISSVPMNNLKQGTMSDEHREWLEESIDEFRELRIILDTESSITVDNIRAKAIKQAQSEDGLDMIIIDYLQLITPVGNFSSKREAILDISRSVKLLAKQLDVPIMVLAQVNKKKDDSEDDLPRMDQIMESYSIAQDSDIVILLHRDVKTEDPDPQTLVILEKNRNGESNKIIRCRSDLACSKFMESKRISPEENDDDIFDSDEPDVVSEEEFRASIEQSAHMFDGFDEYGEFDQHHKSEDTNSFHVSDRENNNNALGLEDLNYS